MEEKLATATLYVVATPIGNLRDITQRALDVLRAVDMIAAEDTRVTARLLAHYGIEKAMMSLHEHNERRAAERVVERLAAGGSVALVTDAGTPGISDPGASAVAAVRDAGYRIVAIPGPSALTAAWSVAGLGAGPMLFYGFLSSQETHRRRLLERLAPLPFALVFYEAPHRIVATAKALADVLGHERRVVVARELTKVFETIESMPLGTLCAWLEADPDRRRGELVLMVSAPEHPVEEVADAGLAERIVRELAAELPPSQAARIAARITGLRRSTLYAIAQARGGRAAGTD